MYVKKNKSKNVFGNWFQLGTLLGLITSIYLSDTDRFTDDVFTLLCGE